MKDRWIAKAETSRHLLEIAEQELSDCLEAQLKAQNNVDDLAQSKAEIEAALLLGEMSKEGRINGSNAEKRKLQTVVFLSDMAEVDAPYSQVYYDLQEAEADLASCKLDTTKAANRFSRVKHDKDLVEAVVRLVGS